MAEGKDEGKRSHRIRCQSRGGGWTVGGMEPSERFELLLDGKRPKSKRCLCPHETKEREICQHLPTATLLLRLWRQLQQDDTFPSIHG